MADSEFLIGKRGTPRAPDQDQAPPNRARGAGARTGPAAPTDADRRAVAHGRAGPERQPGTAGATGPAARAGAS